MVNLATNVSLLSKRKVSKLLEVVKAETWRRTECLDNHFVFQMLNSMLKLCLREEARVQRALPRSPWSVTSTARWKLAVHDSCPMQPLQAALKTGCMWLVTNEDELPQSSKRNHTPRHTRVLTHKHSRSALIYSSCNQEEQKPPFPVMKHPIKVYKGFRNCCSSTRRSPIMPFCLNNCFEETGLQVCHTTRCKILG